MQHSDKVNTNHMNENNICPHNPNIMHTNNECIENPMKDNIEAVVETFFSPEGKTHLCTEIPIRLEIAIIAVVLWEIIAEREKICL